MMKTWLIMLPLLCAAGVAMAEGAGKEGATDQPSAVAAPAAPAERAAAPAQAEATPEAKAPVKAAAPVKATTPAKPKPRPRHRMGKRAHKTLPTGDVRYCLDRKSDAEIIRCSETRRKK